MTVSQHPARIAILAGTLGHGGIGAIVRDHCARWPDAGLAVELVLAREASPFDHQIDPRVRVTRLATLHPLWGVIALARWLRRARPDVVVVHRPRLLQPLRRAIALGGVRPRCIGAVHGMLSQQFAADPAPNKRRALRDLTHCDALVASSRGAARDACATLGLPAAAIAVAYPPVCPVRLRALADAAPATSVGALQDYVVSVGRLEAVKDHATALAAFARIAHDHPQLELVLVGEGAERGPLQACAVAMGLRARVHFTGFAANPYPWIARARALVLCSREESLGIVLAEALALGTPVIATDCPAGPAEVLADGLHGRLVPVGDVSALATAIATTLTDPIRPDPNAIAPFDPTASSAVWLNALYGHRV